MGYEFGFGVRVRVRVGVGVRVGGRAVHSPRHRVGQL